MKTENEVIERYLKNIVPPECESPGHQGRLRAELLARVKRQQAGGMLRGHWKTAALVLGLLAAAAVAAEVAVQVYRFHFEGRVADGGYLFLAESPKGATMTVVGDYGKELDAAGLEQKGQDLDEVARLRQQNARQLVSVAEWTVNGQPQDRAFRYKYQLPGGRTELMNEGEWSSGSAQEQQQGAQQVEEARLQGRGEIIGVDDTELDGQVRRTLWRRYVLADGRVFDRAEGDPEAARPAKDLTAVQLIELFGLVSDKQGTSLARFEAAVHGRTFRFEKYAYRLADGTAVTYAEGQPPGRKVKLTKSDQVELSKLRQAGAGEPLAGYTAEIRGRMCLFKPMKYVLSDGTEVVWAEGQPMAAK